MTVEGHCTNDKLPTFNLVNVVNNKKKAIMEPDMIRHNNDDPSLAWTTDENIYNEGPDQLLPSSAIYTWHAYGAVQLSNLGTGDAAKRAPISVPTLLETAVERSPDRMALAVKRNGTWRQWSYREYLKDVKTAARGFITLGLEPYHSVCILGFTAPEWFISDLAAIFAGGFAVGIYTTSSAEACQFVAKDSKANIIVLEDDSQLEKILRYRDNLTDLKAIIQYTGEPKDPTVYSWAEFMMLGEQQPDDILNKRLQRIAVNQCCTLVYTSGTTGNPKGVMLSHDNLTWAAHVNCTTLKLQDCAEEYISFLPLSHVAAQIYDLYCALTCSASIYIADRNALKGSLFETMKEIQPTFVMAVPRVWEKLYEKMVEIDRGSSWMARIVTMWAKSIGLERSMQRMAGVENPESLAFKIANKLVFSQVRDSVGLSRCRVHLSGTAPIKPGILEYFMGLNTPVTEVYGLSECTGPHCTGLQAANILGSVGKTMLGMDAMLSDIDGKGQGELCVGGRHVHMGYLNQPEKTRDAMDGENGWFYSGDIARVDKDGYIFITGRIKELLITSGGEKVCPIPIENSVKSELPFVSQAMLLGDQLKFLSVFLTLKTEVDPETLQLLDTLQPFTRDWVNENGDCAVITVQDVLEEIYVNKNNKLVSAIQAGIDKVNMKASSRAQKVQKWRILPVDFSIAGGEFGPTLKLRRSTVVEKYQHFITEMYKNL